jgi:hypothetical protein
MDDTLSFEKRAAKAEIDTAFVAERVQQAIALGEWSKHPNCYPPNYTPIIPKEQEDGETD